MNKTYLFCFSNEDKNVLLRKEKIDSIKKAQQKQYNAYDFPFTDKEREELEFRIGKRISQEASDSELTEFDQINDSNEALKWLEKNVPNYRTMVKEIRESYIHELTEKGERSDTIKGIGVKQTNKTKDDNNQKQEALRKAEQEKIREKNIIAKDKIEAEKLKGGKEDSLKKGKRSKSPQIKRALITGVAGAIIGGGVVFFFSRGTGTVIELTSIFAAVGLFFGFVMAL